MFIIVTALALSRVPHIHIGTFYQPSKKKSRKPPFRKRNYGMNVETIEIG